MKNIFIRNLGVKQIDRLLVSFSNISRSLFVSIIGLVVNYILIHYKSGSVLNGYVYCITLVNLLFVFCNWGGKDHNIQVMAQNTSAFNETFSILLMSRLVLFIPTLIPVIFLPASLMFKCFIGVYLFLKVTSSFLESIISIQKKFHSFLLIDLFLNTTLVSLLLLDRNYDSPQVFLTELLMIEVFRTLICFMFFGKHFSYTPNFNKILLFLKGSRHFFYISLAGFLCSKADLYVVGILMDGAELSRYFILLNLVILGQVAFHTFISTFRSAILRYNEKSFARFRYWSLRVGALYSIACTGAIFLMSNIYYKLNLSISFTTLVFINLFVFSLVSTQVLAYTRIDKQRAMANIILFSGLVNVLLSLVLVRFIGVEGAFLSNTAAQLLNYLLFRKFYADKTTTLDQDL